MPYETAHRYQIRNPTPVPVTETGNPSSAIVATLPANTLVVCAEIKRIDGNEPVGNEPPEALRIRISAPAGWIPATDLAEAPRHSPLALGWEAFEANHTRTAPGDQYGLDFPFTHQQLQASGPDFLTRAFHAAATLEPSNRVERIRNYRIIDGGGASTNASFEVEYRRDAPSMPKKLFAKMPATDPRRKFITSHMLFGETQIAMRFAALDLPVPVTRYLFGDYCRATSNGLLITECIPFGEPPIEKILPKGLDPTLPNAAEYYDVLTGLQARLVAFHKRGGLGPEAEAIFPFRTKNSGMPPVELAPLLDFVREKVPHLIPPRFSDPALLTRIETDGQRILDSLPELARVIGRDVDYTGFCHANLNLDNAWFWRTPEGKLEAGLIDWGSAGQMSLGQSFQGMLFAANPDDFLALRRRMVDRFVTDYEAAAGVQLDASKLLLHAKIASMTGLPLLVYALQDLSARYADERLRALTGPNDPLLRTDSGLGTMLSMLGTFLSEWFDTESPEQICRRVL